MSEDQWLVDYYHEWLDDPLSIANTNRKHLRLLLDYLLENGLLVYQIKVVASGWHCHGDANLVISGICYDETTQMYNFTAYYIQNPKWQIPEELPNILDSVEVEAI